MSLFKKLLKSTEREDFSTMKKEKQLEVIRKEILKDINKKQIDLKR